MKNSITSLLLLAFCFLNAQESVPFQGIRNVEHAKIAITNANIQINPETSLKDARLLIDKNKIVQVGEDIKVPSTYRIIDMDGKYIYPSFIDLYTDYAIDSNYQRANNGAYYWNKSIQPEFNSIAHIKKDKNEAKRLRSLGFGSVITHSDDGIARGLGCLISLGEQKASLEIIDNGFVNFFSLNKGTNNQSFPSSHMGLYALLRQSIYDAIWYKENKSNGIVKNLSLEAYGKQWSYPQCIKINSHLDIRLINELEKEFKIPFLIVGNGDEYKALSELKNMNAKLVVPISFPAKPKISDSYSSLAFDLATLKHWEDAPFNLKKLQEEEIPFAITSLGNKKSADFWKNIILAHQCGLSKESILSALTTIPASFIDNEKKIGQLKPGFIANFIVFDGPLLSKNSKLEENWVQGKKYLVERVQKNIGGIYELRLNNEEYILNIEDSVAKIKGSITYQEKKKAVTITHDRDIISLSFSIDSFQYLLSGSKASFLWSGHFLDSDGEWSQWTATKLQEKSYPAGNFEKRISVAEKFIPAYPWKKKENKDSLLIKNATVWTSQKQGILEKHDVIIYSGKVVSIGVGLKLKKGEIIDATGKHLTAGIVDEHSHIAIRGGVNESGMVISSMARVKDAINPYDVNIYRQLAGGVTSAQLLHGSANPIGGQSAIIKLKWEKPASKMLYNPHPKFIKFALGENVKRANSHCSKNKRYPQTRMGVEQIMYDAFKRAEEYKLNLKKDRQFPKISTKEISTKRDLSLDALSEVLEQKRHITCHSYIQSEINMILHLADSFGFKLNTFTHILEGYKVADKLAKHGAAASTFSDWWAYKYEVKDAIPYNASILHKMNVLTAINSDDGEMGRRLNQEAAKAIKYGDISELDAWNMITINPAKMLHIDDRVGSISLGKDADLVLWSGPPLSVYSKAEKTWIEGVLYFDIDEDEYLRKYHKSERGRLIQKIIQSK